MGALCYYSGMDNLAKQIASILSSGPAIAIMAMWVVFHTATTREYVSFISDVTFLAALLILRDEKIMSDKTDKNVKQDLRATKRIEDKLNAKPKKTKTR